ncbi:polynucleotide adenylyltransferase PcnB [Moritella marina ATCC 15381]|uniref:Poly(A) polymerase I n=1 Tax=Moritella marina ATCC 15381 TaxID=1202962 RepID=A0A5J6WGU7_MORMI|nr:polynucleotide adenylyltransferase PcnB [Moritella marina ATCC 15381]
MIGGTKNSTYFNINSRCTIFTQITKFCKNILSRKQLDQTPDVQDTASEAASNTRKDRDSASKKAPSQTRSHETTVSTPAPVITQDTPVLGLNELKLEKGQHPVNHNLISENALKVLYRLHKSGYQAYLVGGGVRDIFIGQEPKDFDIATNAEPEQIKKLFHNCRLVGRRFRLAHILFGRDMIEVATFRGHHVEEENQQTSKQSDGGMLLRDNVYGTISEDAERRDFTVNALYYNIADRAVYDFAGGLADLQSKQLRLIGDPETRYREDPVRMLRAVRFAAKLDMQISPDAAAPIKQLASLLSSIPAARLFEETLKLFLNGQGLATYKLMKAHGLFQPLFPLVSKYLNEDGSSNCDKFIEIALENTDNRINAGKRVTPAYLYAAMLWYPLEALAEERVIDSGLNYNDALLLAMNDALDSQTKSIAIPRRFTSTIRDIWHLQGRLPRRQGKRAEKAFEHLKFRAGFDFLEMRADIQGGDLVEVTQWWQDYQNANATGRLNLVKELNSPAGKKTRPRRVKKKKPAATTHVDQSTDNGTDNNVGNNAE